MVQRQVIQLMVFYGRMMYLFPLIFITLLQILYIKAGNIVCKSTEKCDCLNITSSGIYEYQCPPASKISKTIIHVYPYLKKLKIDCNETDFLDSTFLPEASFDIITNLIVVDCPVPRNGFKGLLKTLNITKLTSLEFYARYTNETINTIDLSGLYNLKTLDLTQNRMNKKIVHLDRNTFKYTPQLSELLLNDNEIQLTDDVFEDIPNLLFLSLYNNNLSQIPKKLFKNLGKLEHLDLWNNKLQQLETEVFDSLTNLTLLELSLNGIQKLNETIFNGLTNLVNISLRRNKLQEISRNVFKNCPNIEMIKLDDNPNLILVDDVFSNFSFLKTVYLSYNELHNISDTLFSGSFRLKTIRLDHNKLTFIPKNVFEDLSNLKELWLNDNRIDSIHQESFSSLDHLEYLHLQYNNLATLNESTLHSLINLKEINLSYNKIVSLPQMIFSRNKNLLKFSMRKNQFNFGESNVIGGGTILATDSCKNLKFVDLSYNKITIYPSEFNRLTGIEEIDLEHNAIEEIKMTSLQTSNPSGLKVNLNSNKISGIKFENINFLSQNAESFKTTVEISSNPILCDCNALELAKYIQTNGQTTKTISLEFGRLECAGPPALKGSSIDDEELLKNLVCPLERNCTKNGECNCVYRPLDKAMIVDCSKRNLTIVPELTKPEMYTEFNHTEVNLEGNLLERCPGEYDGYMNVTKLNLQGNYIHNVTWLPASLKILDIRSNGMKYIDAFSVKLLNQSKIEELKLGNNPLKCDCRMTDFAAYLRKYISQIHIDDIRCNQSGKPLFEMSELDLCGTTTNITLLLVLIILAWLLAVVSTGALYYKYQKEILIWLYGRGYCLWLVKEEEIDKDKIYDAFVCFSHKDEQFVTEKLITTLEGGDQPFKLCVHVRDFIPGEMIQTQIISAVTDSKRTIIVLSSNFLESVWGKVEFRTAHSESMAEGRARVIIVIYGDVDIESLDDELKAYMKTNTYIKWGDPWFWDKLRYALPRRRRNNLSRKHNNMMQFIDDKFLLVNKQPISSPNTTPPVLEPEDLEQKNLTCIA